MKQYYNRVVMNNIDQFVQMIFRNQGNMSQYSNNLKPSYPKIVLYSNLNNANEFLENFFPAYRYIQAQPEESDILSAKKVSQDIYSEEQDKIADGVILSGYPFNTTQALNLDGFINGVNLAVFLSNGDSQYKQSIAPLLKYYEERGSLVEINQIQQPTLEQIESIRYRINSTMKLDI